MPTTPTKTELKPLELEFLRGIAAQLDEFESARQAGLAAARNAYERGRFGARSAVVDFNVRVILGRALHGASRTRMTRYVRSMGERGLVDFCYHRAGRIAVTLTPLGCEAADLDVAYSQHQRFDVGRDDGVWPLIEAE